MRSMELLYALLISLWQVKPSVYGLSMPYPYETMNLHDTSILSSCDPLGLTFKACMPCTSFNLESAMFKTMTREPAR
jgi:hypothetical protein